jgi:tRNA threonylcarbamoyladenosine biosynthesis protein TsaE
MALYPFSILSSSPEETMAAGERIAALLSGGDVLALRGPLGAGKTCLVKGMARFFGIEGVTSPSYTIVHEHEGRLPRGIFPFYHIDAYRLGGDEDFRSLGGEEIISGGGISVVEWSERIPESLPGDAFLVEIRIGENGRRHILVGGSGR